MFDVKKRRYFGNTSMEAEVSLLMANQTLVRRYGYISSSHSISFHTRATWQASPGKLIYDPFVGTGSMAYVCPRRLPFLAHQILSGPILITTDDSSFRSAGIRLRYRRQTDARKRRA